MTTGNIRAESRHDISYSLTVSRLNEYRIIALIIKVIWKLFIGILNPFLAYAPLLYPLKTPEKQRPSGVFRGYKMETLARNGLTLPLTVSATEGK